MSTFQKIRSILEAFYSDENGAVFTEYALVTVFIGLSAIVIFKLFPPAIRAYLARFYSVVSLPIP